jgi:hypothetical protein
LFVGSHLGDSQLVRIHTSPISDTSTPTLPIPADVLTSSSFSTSIKGKGKGRAWVTEREIEGCVLALNGTFIEVLDTWQNVGPILDAVLTDIDGNGQVILVPLMVLILAETICVAAYRNGFRRHEHWQPTYYPEWCTFPNRCCH